MERDNLLAGPPATYLLENEEAAAALAGAGVTWLLEAFAPGQDAAEIEAYVRSGPVR